MACLLEMMITLELVRVRRLTDTRLVFRLPLLLAALELSC
uniref:Uncharacterized protein n=1 Tax=Arundo donax TaxID=35708 RepID=A0A0A9GA23_ARUDO